MAFWALWASYCYSEPYTYGYTENAAKSGLTWDMALPKETGLVVNNVIYQYTTVKNPDDQMLVHVQNLNAKGSGYIFRQTDDWSGRPSNTISKVVPVDNIPIQYWGKGSIQVDGRGTVEKANVVYSYRIDECFDPKPGCPGYVPKIPDVSYNALDDDAVKQSMLKTEVRKYEDKVNTVKERAIKEAKDADSDAQKSLLEALNASVSITAYYSRKIDGGVYKDTVALKDSKLPESRIGLRNGLAQQLLHTKMVDMQFER